MFNERKAAQIAAFFIRRCPEKRLSGRRLQTLMATAEREALVRFGLPMIWDAFFLNNYGLILVQVGDLMVGRRKSNPDGWSAWIGLEKSDGSELSVMQDDVFYAKNEDAELTDVSLAEADLLESVWSRHKGATMFLPMINKQPIPFGSVSYSKVAKLMGYSEEASTEIEAQVKAEADVARMLAQK